MLNGGEPPRDGHSTEERGVSQGIEEPWGGNREGRPLDGGVRKASQGIEEPQGGIREGRLGLI